MDFKDQIKQLSERVDKLKDNLLTEEATKNALVMPFLQYLGYDVFDPLEVVPEFTCDIGSKKGEKIDYAIMQNGSPILLIECKHWKQSLNLHDNQLLRYFHTSSAKFGLLTNGIEYRFYTDLENPNKMDERPFLQISLDNLQEEYVDELKKFHKSYFDVANILSSANELKYTRQIKDIIHKEFTNPSPDLVKLIIKQVYDGVFTARLLEQFTVLLKNSIRGYMSDQLNARLKSALSTNDEKKLAEENTDEITEGDAITTTGEELEAYTIVKSILRTEIEVSRIIFKDARTYFGIFLDNQRKTICRIYLNGKKKFITVFDNERKEIRFDIETLDDIYLYADQIKLSMQRHEQIEG